MRSTGLRRRLKLLLGAVAATSAVVGVAVPAQAAQGTWERAWGGDVVTGGGTALEICTVAADCKAGTPFPPGLGGEMRGPQGIAV